MDVVERPTFRCDTCPFKSHSDMRLTNHKIATHQPRESFKCEYCDYQTKYRQKLRQHIAKVHVR